MLPVTWTSIRVFLHVLAATVWVGGQLTLAALVPALRAASAEAPRAAARRFNAVAWPAYGVLIVTGAWNLVAEREEFTGRYRTTVAVKVALVALSGLAAVAHSRARTVAGLAVFGALTGVTALAALFVGVLLSSPGH
jgi:putative copper export protein